MGSQTNKIRRCSGVLLVDTMIVVVILMIAVIGTSSLKYYTAVNGRKAVTQTTAAGIALMLCQSWCGFGGDENYDPATHLNSILTIDAIDPDAGPDKREDFTLLGNYAVTLNGANFYTTLSWKDVQPGLRALNVILAWAQRGPGEDGTENVDKLFRVTIYTSMI